MNSRLEQPSTRPARPWQRNLMKVPQNILDTVARLPKNELVVACLRKIPKSDIRAGAFSHIDLLWGEHGLSYPSQLVPSSTNGRYSKANIDGKEVVLKDLPMTTRTVSVNTPNFGDWSRGSHEVTWDREVYQRSFIPPRELAIRIEQVAEDVQAQAIVFRFTVDEVLDRTAPDFQDRLLFDLNLLQENVGNHGVFESTSTVEEYLRTLYVNWELLPPGEREQNIAKIFRSLKTDDPRVRQQITQRYDYLARLRPREFIRGTNGLRNYFGAQFADDLVVFEHVEYGNAIYVMFEDWAELSQKSRTELMAQHPDKIVRIPHSADWRGRLSDLIRKERKKRQQP